MLEDREGGGVIRYAEPGEFTKRAFMNDRLDLTQVEALGDVLSATTEQQRRLYVRGTTNQLSRRYEAWRSQLLYARGELEALIDFSEDQYFDESPALLTASVAEQVRRLRTLVQAHSKNAVRGELLRNGISISLLGAPNAGKSSLLNRIVGREAAIVSQEAGTTRDIVEVGIDLGVIFAGWTVNEGGETEIKQGIISKIEQEGMRRAKERATESDVVIAVLSFERQSHDPDTTFLAVDSEVAGTAAALTAEKRNVLVVVNKTDLVPSKTTTSSALQTIETAIPGLAASQIHFVSCREAELSKSPDHVDPGRIQAFLTGLVSKFHEMTSPLGTSDPSAGEADPSFWQESLGASERHRLLLEECQEHLTAFLAEVEGEYAEEVGEEHYGNDEVDVVLAAESLRAAGNCLARITGKGEAGDVEEVLGVVFEKFCVGK
ncbi:mitochondrial splicing system protein [Taxawa tesnikishii (nom. ined.)]|nr:mitochondrial splicing system protein [Dothideales sp. JES 119]